MNAFLPDPAQRCRRGSAPREIVYLGWTGHGNFGDEVLAETWRRALVIADETALLRRAHLTAPLRTARAWSTGARRERIVLLGGGTTLGFKNWARHAADALRVHRARAVIVAGAGAAEADDSFALRLQQQDWAAWQALPVSVLGVRGPLTAAACDGIWSSTPVVGDAALLCPSLLGLDRRVAGEGPLGLCLGADPRSRYEPEVLAAAADELLRRTGAPSVRLFALSPSDVRARDDVARYLDVPFSRHVFTGDVEETVRQLACGRLVLSERLHGAVAAVASGVPTVPLAYASKCDDFWLSVTDERPTVRPGCSVDDVLSAAEAALDPLAHEQVVHRADELCRRLRESVAHLASWREGLVELDQR